MANVTAGDYYIVPKANTALALDVADTSLKNGSNVRVYTRNNKDAQVFSVSYRTDGSAQIVSRLAGKSIDVAGGTLSSGTNVLIWTDTDARNQKWTITDLSETETIGGVSYPLFAVRVFSDPGLSLTGGSTSGNNASITTTGTGSTQKWAFIPVPPFQSGGVYELRSMLDTGMCVDIATSKNTDGANARLYTASGGNSQKFVFVDEGDGWSVRNIASQKYLDVSGGTFRNGTNVLTWADNDQRNQRWLVQTYSTTTVDGKTCQVVALGAGNDDDFFLDADKAMSSNNTNVLIWEPNSGNNQRWALYPTNAVDSAMPTPHTLGLAESVGGAPKTSLGAKGPTVSVRLYPTWSCSDAWATDGPNHYEWRYRTRKMSSVNSKWDSWSSWTAWATANVTQDGVKAWVTEGVAFTYAISSYKSMEFEMQVRSVGADNYSLIQGPVASEVCTIGYRPTVDVSSVSWSPDGLVFACTCDYDAGTARAYVTSVKAGGREMLASMTPCELSGGEITVPQESLVGIPLNGDTVIVSFNTGTDQVARFDATDSDSATVSYGTTSTVPDIYFNDDLTAVVTAPSGSRLWCVGDMLRECGVLTDNGTDATYEVLYPLGIEYSLFLYDGEDMWYADMEARQQQCHAWNWSGGAFLLECRSGNAIETAYSLKADYASYMLDSRPRETVRVGKTLKGSFTAIGSTIPGATQSDERAALALQEAVHCVYRSPNGWVRDVAVTSIDAKIRKGVSEFSVSMVEEAV